MGCKCRALFAGTYRRAHLHPPVVEHHINFHDEQAAGSDAGRAAKFLDSSLPTAGAFGV